MKTIIMAAILVIGLCAVSYGQAMPWTQQGMRESQQQQQQFQQQQYQQQQQLYNQQEQNRIQQQQLDEQRAQRMQQQPNYNYLIPPPPQPADPVGSFMRGYNAGRGY